MVDIGRVERDNYLLFRTVSAQTDIELVEIRLRDLGRFLDPYIGQNAVFKSDAFQLFGIVKPFENNGAAVYRAYAHIAFVHPEKVVQTP